MIQQKNSPFSIEIFNTRIFPSRHFANNFFNASLAKKKKKKQINLTILLTMIFKIKKETNLLYRRIISINFRHRNASDIIKSI